MHSDRRLHHIMPARYLDTLCTSPHVQIAVVKEHEARQLAERNLAEAHAVAVPNSAAAELDIQVHLHLKFRSDMCSLCQVDF